MTGGINPQHGEARPAPRDDEVEAALVMMGAEGNPVTRALLRDYLTRGRSLRNMPSDELQWHWRDETRGISQAELTQRFDLLFILYELCLRGIPMRATTGWERT